MGINKWAMASLPWLFLFVITREVVPAMNSSSPRNWGLKPPVVGPVNHASVY